MKVKEAIERLKKFDENAEILLIQPEEGFYNIIARISLDIYAKTKDNRDIVNIFQQYLDSDEYDDLIRVEEKV